MFKQILFICSFLGLAINAEACCWTSGNLMIHVELDNVNRSQGGAGDWNDINYLSNNVVFNTNVIGYGNDYHVEKINTTKYQKHEQSKTSTTVSIDGWYDKRQSVPVYDAARNTRYNTEAYYKLTNNVVKFNYLGREHACNINQSLYEALDYTNGSPVWLNLHADTENQGISCGDNSPFMYKVIPGNWEWTNHYYGSVVIYLNPAYKYVLDYNTHYTGVYTDDTNFSDYYVASVAKDSLRSHSSLEVDTANKFGFDNRIANGIVYKDNNTDINQKLTNGYDVIGAAKDIVVNFKYKGEPSSCQLQAQIGYSRFGNIFEQDHFYGVWYILSNPYGSKNLDQSPAQCINNPGFGYQIVHDTYNDDRHYSPMYIKLVKFDRKAPEVPVTYNLFVNGVMNGLDGAMLSANKLQDYGPQSNKKYIQYGFLYNRSNGRIGDFYDLYGMKYFDDIIVKKQYLETYEQSTGEQCPAKSDPNFAACDKKARDWFLATIFAGNAKDIGINPQDVYGHDFDSVWTSFMNYGITPDDKIILTAHSQGNLYSNVLLNYLKYAKGYKKENLNVVHIGVTSSDLSSSYDDELFDLFSNKALSSYITDIKDVVIDGWLVLIAKVGGQPPVLPNKNGTSITGGITAGHNYLNDYLKRDSNIDAIVDSTYAMNTVHEIELSYLRKDEAVNMANVFVINNSPNDKYSTYFYGSTKSRNNNIVYTSNNQKLDINDYVYYEPSNNVYEFRLPLGQSYLLDIPKDTSVVVTVPNAYNNVYCNNQPFIMKASSNEVSLKCGASNYKVLNANVINGKLGLDFGTANK